MNITLIIAVYNDYESLFSVLKSLENQSFKDFEVIIAEDCQKKEMLEFLKNNSFHLKIKHVSQEDKGFRKNKILNKAIKISSGKYFIFVDGDCMVHKDYVYEYSKKFKENRLIVGRRVMLSGEMTKKIKYKFYVPGFIEILFSNSNYKEEGIKLPYLLARKNINGLIGSNFGISKKLLLKINGFDEDYEAPGVGEDDDIYMRLKKLNEVEFVSIRNRALQYHLEHSRSDRTSINGALFEEKKKGSYFCKNGLEKVED